MKFFTEKVLGPLCVSVITAVAVLLWSFNGRLVRIETQMATIIARLDASHISTAGQSPPPTIQLAHE